MRTLVVLLILVQAIGAQAAHYNFENLKTDLYYAFHPEKPHTNKYQDAPNEDYCAFAREYVSVFPEFFGDPVPDEVLALKSCSKAVVKNYFKQWPKHGDSRLNEIEGFLITDYVIEGFEYLNGIAKNPKRASHSTLIRFMDSALGKLPDYQGVVYEGNRILKAGGFRPGMIVHSPGYFSTSLETKVPAMFATGVVTPANFDYPQNLSAGVVFKLHVKNGKDLSHTFNSNEKEVLIPRNSTFRVLGRVQENGIEMVEMKQILPQQPSRLKTLIDKLRY